MPLAGALPARRAAAEFFAGGAWPRCPEFDAHCRNTSRRSSGMLVAP